MRALGIQTRGIQILGIQILGPVRAWRGDTPVDLGPTGQRGMLGLLALAAGQPLSRAELMTAVWGERPPPSATNMIQTRVKHLRRLLEPDRRSYGRSSVLPSVGDGYALQVPDVDIDLLRFRHLAGAATRARQQGNQQQVATLLREALGLWQGPPLADVPFLAGHPKVVALAAERRAAVALCGEAMMATGGVDEALPMLEEAAADQPLDEAASARLIRAYQQAGRRAQAFAEYRAIRRRLADELGVDPGPELTAAHTALLRETNPPAAPAAGGDMTAPAAPAPASAPVAPPAPRPSAVPRPVPAQLPGDIPVFTGRDWQLRQLDEMVSGEGGAPAVVVSSVAGAAGVGKTALAVHWAHLVRGRFPDGQLHANLRGFDPVEAPAEPVEVMKGFLDAFGVPPQQIPAGTQALTGLYRSTLADRRVLILLDNARDADQVRPLLPGAPGCLVVVTSRNRLAGLVAAEGARPLALDVLPVDEARRFLARRLGTHRAAAEPGAVEEIISGCARLPLALAIVAARAATDPALPLATLAAQLRSAGGTLDALAGEDGSTDVRAAFSWSYRLLGEAAARLFRLLALHPGSDIAAPAAASLAGLPPARVRPLLAELARVHLIAEHAPGRYTMHDLLRTYSAELATADPAADRAAAQRRVLDHYLRTAAAGALLLTPHRDPLPPVPPEPGVTPEELADYDAALAWFEAEHDTLVPAVDRAAAAGLHTHAWQIAAAAEDHLRRGARWSEWAATQRTALAAGERLDDLAVQADAHRGLGRAYTRLARYDEAGAHFARAAAVYAVLGDDTGLANTHLGTSYAAVGQGDHALALRHAQRALDSYRAAGNRRGQATTLNLIGWYHVELGAHAEALACCQQALDLHQALGDQYGEANNWDSLGHVHYRLAEHKRAATCYQRALDLYHQLGDRYYEADTLAKAGANHLAAGDLQAARTTWRRALALLAELDQHSFVDYDANEVRTRLAHLDDVLTGASSPL